MAKTFPARWDGECSRCNENFEAGDDIGYDDEDELVCAECFAKAEEDGIKTAAGWRNFVGVVKQVDFRECEGTFNVTTGFCDGDGCAAIDFDRRGQRHGKPGRRQ